MTYVFTDKSRYVQSKVSEGHYFDSFTCFAVVPGLEIHKSEEMIGVVSPGIPNWLTNTVVRSRLSTSDVDAVIGETLAYFRARDVIPNWRPVPVTCLPILRSGCYEKGSSHPKRSRPWRPI